jgi:hypothetical protein
LPILAYLNSEEEALAGIIGKKWLQLQLVVCPETKS